MKIAIVGGGSRCLFFLNILATYRFSEVNPEVVAIADINPDAPGVKHLRSRGVYYTDDYSEFLTRDDLDVLLDLTGQEEIFTTLCKERNLLTTVLNEETGIIFFEGYRPRECAGSRQLNFKRTKQLCDLFFAELVNEEVFVIDTSRTIIDVNNLPLTKYGLERKDVIGKRCHEVTHQSKEPCTCKTHPCPLVEIQKSRQPYRCTHIHYDKEGRRILHSISAYPIFENNEIVGIVELARDITWETSMQKSFGDQEKLSAIGRLAAGVAHELNNPLTTVLTSTMLIQEEMDPKHPDYEELELVKNETLRCRNIVTNLLNFARQSKPVKQLDDLNQIVVNSMALIRKQADFKNIVLKCDTYPGKLMVFCDRDQIQQCLINLGLNATDATPPGGRITFSTDLVEEGTMARISVADTGEGLDQSIQDSIFEPFFTTKETGTGLGLSITHGFVKQHKGFIDLESQKGHGATFSIRLPLQQEQANA
ncbi:MAG: PAS domain-containing protein [Desulfatibacillum sp.]|nr:PAS domain-containing protein [Desulfatibacillum sp.]